MNILLITAARNSDKSATWVVLSKFVRIMRSDMKAKIQVICLSPLFKSKSGELGEKIYNTLLRNGLIVGAFSRINKNYMQNICKFYAKFYINKVINQIKIHQINKLWVETDMQSLLILNEILKKKEIPYHLTVFDDMFFYKGKSSYKNEINFYKRLFYNSKSIDTPTNNLYNYYKDNKFISSKTKAVESFVGIFRNYKLKPKITNKVKKIALTGSIYGIDALAAFISAVVDILHKENIEFHYMTKASYLELERLKTKYKETFKNIKIIPFVPENKLISELQNYDLLYLPMKFDKQFSFQTNTSFPSKTHNYLASQIPIIVHTPNNSALYNFFTGNKVGCVIDTLDPDIIVQNFIMLLDEKIRKNISNKIRDLNKVLIQNHHIKELYNLINETH